MLDRDRLLARVDQLQGYLRELRTVVPPTLETYRGIEKRRACERLLQLAIEAATDICGLLVAGLRLGLPAEERDAFEKLCEAGVISPAITETLKRMRGFRNILVHEYTRVDDRIVYDVASARLGEFDAFIGEVLHYIRHH
jgi:uncharacterized protein YutE (UPF0331/DUF86 family)